MRWFRFYDDALNDPKVQRLSPHLFRAWVNCLCLASKGDGHLPSIADIAFNLRMSENDAKSAIEDLILAELIDVCPDGRMEPHNWGNRQFASDTSKDRTRKWRKNKEKASGDVTVTACDEIGDGIDSDTDTESKTDTDTDLAAREVKRSFNSNFLDKGGRGVSPRLKVRAEGLGLDADALERQATAAGIKIPDAKFRSLVVQAISRRCPNASENLIRAALCNGNEGAYGALCQMIVEIAA